jgi:hypothetical protein
MTHLEGAIVNSVYDTALIAWAEALDPPLPCLTTPACIGNVEMFHDTSFQALFDENGSLRVPHNEQTEGTLEDRNGKSPLPDQVDMTDADIGAEITRMHTLLSSQNGQT